MAISGHHTTSHTNHHIGVRRFHREIISKRQNIINLVLFGNPIEIALILISDNSGASGSSAHLAKTKGHADGGGPAPYGRRIDTHLPLGRGVTAATDDRIPMLETTEF